MTTWSKDIVEWQRATFGRCTPDSAFQRAREEWEELAEKHGNGGADGSRAVITEAADVVIVLAAYVASQGWDLAQEVERKMKINRARKWQLTGDGCGQHIREDDALDP
jgi:NTP pyrophosphatase (non-canonical NTP hydrolase)